MTSSDLVAMRMRLTTTLEALVTTESWTEIFVDNSTTSSTNISSNPHALLFRELYRYFLPPMMFICVVSVAINITVLVVSYWIKRPISPTLHISLSLAGADACTSLLLGIGLLVNSYLPKVHDVYSSSYECVVMVIEVLRLSGVIITVAHLLALAVNHYLGIIKPLHYVSIMTHRNRTICIIFMWIVPIVFFTIYFSSIEGQGFQSEGCQEYKFLQEQKMRITYASLFFLPLVLMTVIYTHIFVLVQRHQKKRIRFSQGSQFIRENGSSFTRSPHQQRDLSMSIKAIKTTLLILGSFIVGWMPAVLVHLLLCETCLVSNEIFIENPTPGFFLHYIVNFLVIIKTMLNPIIYAARMHEIKKATAVMKARLCGRCLLLRSDGDMEGTFALSSGYSLHGHHRLSQYTDSMGNQHRSNTIICRMRTTPYQTTVSNGSTSCAKPLTRNSTRSHKKRRSDLTLV